jgi:hypothetical protein
VELRRTVVSSLLREVIGDRPSVEADVLAFVDERVRCMPGHLRLGIRATELALTALRRGDVALLEHSWLPPARQYVKFVRSLVLFAAHEHATVTATPA